MLKCEMGIMAYNEEKNLPRLLKFLTEWRPREISIEKIFVVSSGSTDRTEAIVENFSRKNPKIVLLRQLKREGKASAVNLWLSHAKEKLLVLESADTLPRKDAIEKLVLAFREEKIGMVGGRPVPVNDRKNFFGFAAHLLWRLHHRMSLKSPKMGEVVAFRNIVKKIPSKSAVDEASIEKIITENGFEIKYVSDAIFFNKGPQNLQDFLKQRRRIYTGHLFLADQGYSVSTMSGLAVLRLLLANFPFDWRSLLFTPMVILLEIVGRLLGYYDFVFKKKPPYIWEISATTKNLSQKND